MTPEERRAHRRQWYRANRDSALAATKRWRAAHPAESKARAKEYRRRTDARRQAAHLAYVAAVLGIEPPPPQENP